MSLKNNAPQPATRRAEITVPFGGEPRTFRFGMNALIAFCGLYDGNPAALAIAFQANILQAVRDMAYCGLLSRANQNNLPEDFDQELVGDWITDADQEDWTRVTAVMMESLTAGKQMPAPTATAPASK